MNKDEAIKNNGTHHEFTKLEDVKLNKEFSFSYSFDIWGKEELIITISKRTEESSMEDTFMEINIQPEALQDMINASKQALELFSDVFGKDESLKKFDRFSSRYRLLHDDEE